MASSNPYDEGIYPDVPISQPDSAAVDNPYDTLATPIGPDTSVVTKAAEKPYSAFNTVGRMATDAVLGIPDTLNLASRGLTWGVDRATQALTGQPPPPHAEIPYLAPIARKAFGIAELPEDAGWKRGVAEGVGSAVVGGVGSAVGRGAIRAAEAIPKMASILNPWRPIKSVTEDALSASGDKWYKALDNLDVRYTPETGPNIATAIDRGAFKPAGITSQNAPRAVEDINKLRAIDPAANVPYGTTKDYVVPRDIENVRQDLNHTRASAWQPGSGRREGEAANTAIGGIDRFFQNPPASAIHPTSLNDPSLVGPVLANARADTAAAHRLGFLEGTRDEIGTKFAAKPTASASSEAQALRDRSAAALNASREGGGPLYGFNDYEKQLLEKAATPSWLSRYGANAPTSLFGTALHAGSAAYGSHALGFSPSTSAALAAIVPGSEYVAKKLGDWGTRRAYQTAADEIAARSPLAQSMGIPAPPTARIAAQPTVTRADIAAALMAPSVLRQPQRLMIDTSDWQ